MSFPSIFLGLVALPAWRGVVNRLRHPVISRGGLAWHRGWRGAIDWLRYPFSRVTLHLNPVELEVLFGDQLPKATPGLRRLLERLRRRANQRTGELSLSKANARQINRVAFNPSTPLTTQQSTAEFLRQVFERSLGERLDGFDDVFRKSNGVPVPAIGWQSSEGDG